MSEDAKVYFLRREGENGYIIRHEMGVNARGLLKVTERVEFEELNSILPKDVFPTRIFTLSDECIRTYTFPDERVFTCVYPDQIDWSQRITHGYIRREDGSYSEYLTFGGKR